MDVPTIILLLSIGSYVFGLLLIIFQFREKNSSKIPFWILAKFLQGTGSLFLYFENSTSFVIHILFSHTLLLTGCAYEAWAILFILGKTVSRRVHLSVTLLIIFISIFSSFIFPFPRPSVIFLIHTALYCIPAWFLFNTAERSYLRTFLGTCYLILGVIYMGHAIQVMSGFNLLFFIPGKTLFHIMPVATFCMVLISGFSMLLLAIERSNSELLRSKAEVQKKNDELLNLNASKDRFFSIIAHDLKAPFQGLIGYSQMLCSEYESMPDEERLELSKGINELSLDTFKLLGNLLEWSRMQTGMMKCAPARLQIDKEISYTVSLFRHTAQNKNISLEYSFERSYCVFADRNMLAAIIRNLVSNSIKFTDKGGTISLKMREKENTVEIAISDTGVGMDKEKIENLFKIDQKVSTKGTAGEEGTGLGLLLCKEMAEKQNGKISVESRPGEGTTFYFELPKAD